MKSLICCTNPPKSDMKKRRLNLEIVICRVRLCRNSSKNRRIASLKQGFYAIKRPENSYIFEEVVYR